MSLISVDATSFSKCFLISLRKVQKFAMFPISLSIVTKHSNRSSGFSSGLSMRVSNKSNEITLAFSILCFAFSITTLSASNVVADA